MKKFMVLLLSAIIAISLIACSPNPRIKEIKIKGDKITYQEAQAQVELWEKAAEDASFSKGQWYSVGYDMIIESTSKVSSDPDGVVSEIYSFEATVDGKIFLSNFLFENKMHLKINGEMVTTEVMANGDKNEEKTVVEAVLDYIEGNYYVKTVAKTKTKDGTEEIIDYSTSDEVLDEFLGEVSIDEMFEYGLLITALEDQATYHKTKNGLISTYSESSEYGAAEQTYLVEVDHKDGSLKNTQIYVSSVMESDGEKMSVKFSARLKKALFGSVKKPADAWKY